MIIILKIIIIIIIIITMKIMIIITIIIIILVIIITIIMQIILILVYLTMRPFLRNKCCLTWFDIFVLTNIFLYRCIISKMNEVLYSIFKKNISH